MTAHIYNRSELEQIIAAMGRVQDQISEWSDGVFGDNVEPVDLEIILSKNVVVKTGDEPRQHKIKLGRIFFNDDRAGVYFEPADDRPKALVFDAGGLW